MNRIIPTCETAVSAVPEWHRAAFKGCEDRVTSSEGWSPGALNLAQGVASKVHEQLIHNPVTRLLIDLACAPDDPKRWSDRAMTLTDEQREKLDQREQKNFLEMLGNRIAGCLRQDDRPVHISFDTRSDLTGAALVIECDPRLAAEAEFAKSIETAIKSRLPEAVIRIEASPTRGLAAWLREKHPPVLSLRLIAAQSAFLEGRPVPWTSLKKAVVESLAGLR